MFRLLIPLVLGIAGTAFGVAAALYLVPGEPEEEAAIEQVAEPAAAAPCGPAEAMDHAETVPHRADPDHPSEFVRLSNQFVVPIVSGGRTEALIVLSLTIEVAEGQTEAVHTREPRLRTAFLQVMFNHANSGGFAGNFTTSRNVDVLHEALLAEARGQLGAVVLDVLITDMVRQDNAS